LIETFFQSFGFRALEFGFSVFGIFLAFGSLEFGILAVLDFWDFGFQYFRFWHPVFWIQIFVPQLNYNFSVKIGC